MTLTPLYRQEQIYRQRHDVALPRATLARWAELAADCRRPPAYDTYEPAGQPALEQFLSKRCLIFIA